MPSAASIDAKEPQLWVRLTLYPTNQGGKTKPIRSGFGCPCFSDAKQSKPGFSGWPQLGEDWMAPGETRETGYVFLNPDDAVPEFQKSGMFYLWESGIVGEAVILEMPDV